MKIRRASFTILAIMVFCQSATSKSINFKCAGSIISLLDSTEAAIVVTAILHLQKCTGTVTHFRRVRYSKVIDTVDIGDEHVGVKLLFETAEMVEHLELLTSTKNQIDAINGSNLFRH